MGSRAAPGFRIARGTLKHVFGEGGPPPLLFMIIIATFGRLTTSDSHSTSSSGHCPSRRTVRNDAVPAYDDGGGVGGGGRAGGGDAGLAGVRAMSAPVPRVDRRPIKKLSVKWIKNTVSWNNLYGTVCARFQNDLR